MWSACIAPENPPPDLGTNSSFFNPFIVTLPPEPVKILKLSSRFSPLKQEEKKRIIYSNVF